MDAYMYVYIHIGIYTCIHVYIYICMYIYTHVYTYWVTSRVGCYKVMGYYSLQVLARIS